MKGTLHRGAVVVFLVFSAACGASGPTSPTGATRSSAVDLPAPVLPNTFPPLSGPSRTFVFDHELSYQVRDYTRQSRFVLYDNGAFVLQYPSLGERGYRGGYEDSHGVITFKWEGSSGAGPWSATGALDGRSLTVRYNDIMQFSDFEDAEYSQIP